MYSAVAYSAHNFTCNDVIAEWALPVTFGEDGLLAFLGLALAHERSNATKTVTGDGKDRLPWKEREQCDKDRVSCTQHTRGAKFSWSEVFVCHLYVCVWTRPR